MFVSLVWVDELIRSSKFLKKSNWLSIALRSMFSFGMVASFLYLRMVIWTFCKKLMLQLSNLESKSSDDFLLFLSFKFKKKRLDRDSNSLLEHMVILYVFVQVRSRNSRTSTGPNRASCLAVGRLKSTMASIFLGFDEWPSELFGFRRVSSNGQSISLLNFSLICMQPIWTGLFR